MSQSVCHSFRRGLAKSRLPSDHNTEMSLQIQPLRIQKNTPSSSPNKPNGAPTPRVLAELGPMERRRNSPSYNQSIMVSGHPHALPMRRLTCIRKTHSMANRHLLTLRLSSQILHVSIGRVVTQRPQRGTMWRTATRWAAVIHLRPQPSDHQLRT